MNTLNTILLLVCITTGCGRQDAPVEALPTTAAAVMHTYCPTGFVEVKGGWNCDCESVDDSAPSFTCPEKGVSE